MNFAFGLLDFDCLHRFYSLSLSLSLVASAWAFVAFAKVSAFLLSAFVSKKSLNFLEVSVLLTILVIKTAVYFM